MLGVRSESQRLQSSAVAAVAGQQDIQFVAESSLALSHYVTGYVTKAEKSSMQEVWQEIGESGSIYSRLWKFGM